jgi:UDP-N-acetylmuramoylalanine--D-glutamate ligase
MGYLKGQTIDLSGRSLVVGLGITGLSVARYLRARDFDVRIIDSRDHPPGLASLRAEYPDSEIHTGTLDVRWLDGARRVVLSPGLSIDLPLVHAARERGIDVLNDIEIFAQVAAAPIVAVTGSNGKSTVVTLIERFANAAGMRVPAGGNLGPPALDLLDSAEADAYVLEISSFQMETCDSLAPLAAAVLNVTPDHLDRHPSFAHYAALKAKLIRNAGCAVLNWDDPVVRAMARTQQRTIAFSLTEALDQGYSLLGRGDERSIARDGVALIAARDVLMRGDHNLANVMAALALAEALGIEAGAARAVLRTFPGLPHRCEFVAQRRGVVYINDSKATNIGAAAAALRGLQGPIVLIAGGDGKGADFTPMREHVRGKVRAAFVIGRSAAAILAALEGECAVSRCDTLEDAVKSAAACAEAGDTVLLAPACSSLDMFADYRARGAAFKAAVEGLQP